MPRLPIAGALLITALATAAVPAASVSFSDQTSAAGLNFTPSSPADMGYAEMYHGGSVGDFNNDGWPDLFLLGGGDVADALYINNADGTFTDEASAWGVAVQHRGRGTTVGDFNNDGWDDLYVTSSGPVTGSDQLDTHKLYRNNGNGTFTDIAVSAGVNQSSLLYSTATGAAFGDYDLDGDLDLFVTGWEPITCFSAPCDQSKLFRNNGNETFTDVTTAAGIGTAFDGFSPRFVDMNGDRYPELLVAADYGTSRYFVNNGDGTFSNYTAPSGTGLDDNGMGTTVADFNRDGLPDWYVTSIYRDLSFQDGNYLYVNTGSDSYTPLAESAGARDGGWGWGAEAFDFDHDGWTDIAETNGWWETTEWLGETSYLYRNNGDLTFTEAQDGSGLNHTGQGRSLLTLDYDRDGDLDIVITAYDEPVLLCRNDVTGSSAHWLEIALDTSGSPGLAPDGYGSRVIVTAGGVTQYAWVNGGASYLGRSQLVAHFGLGSATVVDQITVEWADGTSKVLNSVAADQIFTISSSATGSPPGEPALQASYNDVSGMIDIDYTPGCDAVDHTIYYGELGNVPTYGYSGAVCAIGTSGSASFDPGLDNAFFLVVGTSATTEGSYGRNGSNTERPEDTMTAGCDLPQDLGATCAP